MLQADLHSHSDCSDGALEPAQLVRRAEDRGVELFSITDHDTVAAYEVLAASKALVGRSIRLVPGIEFSTRWLNTGIHLVGLGIDPRSDAIRNGVARQARARGERAERIAERLEKRGLEGTLAGARAFAGTATIGRPHFARFLVDSGQVATEALAFKHYLGDGKAGDVREHWAEQAQVIDWIRSAGGIAVLAHPLKYRLTRSKLKRLLQDFIAAGGEALEVVSGQQARQQTGQLGRLCREANLLASTGSDFHRPDVPWSELGSAPPLPDGVQPVWNRF